MPPMPQHPQHIMSPRVHAHTWGVCAAITLLVSLLVLFAWAGGPQLIKPRLLIAPMMGGLGPCLYGDPAPAHLAHDPAYVQCQLADGSAAPVIEATLASLTKGHVVNNQYALGYTLHAPLLKFFKQQGPDWVVDTPAVNRLVKTIAQTPRQVVLYLFSTHFSAEAAIEPVLASDPNNMAVHPKGIMGRDKYFGLDVYPWSIARTDNTVTARRLQVIEAMVKALCGQPAAVRARLMGVTVLGETHHHFPAFETGMGFGGAYEVSDYSEASVRNFRNFLAQRFGSIDAVNQALVATGAHFATFDDIAPPAQNVLSLQTSAVLDAKVPLWTHLDSHATGRFPVAGWLAPHAALTGRVIVLLDGREIARVNANLGRQDVLFHKPELGTADVGWRHDVDFSALPPGPHRVSTLAETKQGPPRLMDQRMFTVMANRSHGPNPKLSTPGSELPTHQQVTPWTGNVDEPRAGARYLYNPLASLWQDFRRQQVVDYLQHLARPLETSCLAKVPRYVHQLIPFPNPSWDESKYAIERSLDRRSGFELGVSLYGEASYGRSFFDWKETHRQGGYGVTEFHPLRPMDTSALSQTLDEHRMHGARFLSFFMEPQGATTAPTSKQVDNFLSFDAANGAKGSDQLFHNMRQALTAP